MSPARSAAAPTGTGPGPSAGATETHSGSARRATLLRSLAEVPALALLAVAIVAAVRLFLVQAFYIPSGSMLPQLQLQDKVVVSRLSYRLHSPRRGDIVVFDAPSGGVCNERSSPHARGNALKSATRWVGERLGLTARTDELIKRVIALPGETVQGRDAHVYVNGRLMLEPYLPPGERTEDFGPVTVPKGGLWVMGDNRQNSCDSHYFGPIRRHAVVGRAVLRVWPLTHLSFL